MVALSNAKQALASAGGDVRDRVGPAIGDARDILASAGSEARDVLTPALGDARDRLVPAAQQLVPAAQQAAQQAISGGKRHSRRAAVTLRLAEEPKSRHPVRNLMALLLILGAAFVVYKKFFGGQTPWQDADQDIEPPQPTTPDAPLEKGAGD